MPGARAAARSTTPRIFGPDATYDTIESFLRKPKKKAKELTEEAVARGNATPTKGARSPAVKQPRAPRTPSETYNGNWKTPSGTLYTTCQSC